QQFGEKILTVEGLNYTDKFGTKKVDNLHFSLRAGEVLGVAGIEGNGQKEAMEILTGNMKAESGSVKYKGQEMIGKSVTDNRKAGIAHVPEDRNLNGCAPEMSVRDNLIATSMDKLSKNTILDEGKIEEYCNECVKEFLVKTAGLDISIKSLSGGNVQKAIVAREFTAGADVIVLSQPTRGVDVGAQEFIHKKILEMRDEKKSLILVSADLAELKALSDRIIVFHQGKIAGVLDDVPNVTEEELGLYMLGLKSDSEERLKEA
ncbi:MAG: ATP-binding cassette domain-containing protein, partial [Lachnospiraceae bacterium]|nr:ATP-binding cassette domain-containing protein [Lachnospiraceae bacterium]